MLQQLHWLIQNNNCKYHDGHFWWKHTNAQWLDTLPYFQNEMGMPKTEAWYATRKTQEYMARFPDSRSVADACRYVVNAIDHAWTLEGRPG